MVTKLDSTHPDFQNKINALVSISNDLNLDIDDEVKKIVEDVKKNGDKALLKYTLQFDGFKPKTASSLKVSQHEIEIAKKACSKRAVSALKDAKKRILEYHRHLFPHGFNFEDDVGVRLGARWRAISAVGVYVPGGTAAYPSSVLMNAIPAQIAGVKRLVMTVPATKNNLNPLVLMAAEISGIDEIYRVGGAQAIAALAYGTETISSVDKIVGPGNAYVAAAKRQVYGKVGIDLIAGPTEILVVADKENDPTWIAADLLSQAEHDVQSQSILICDDQQFADSVIMAIEGLLKNLERSNIARASWDNYGVIIVVQDLDSAPDLINKFAPEHVELAVADPKLLAERISNAGAIFLGRYAPEAIGDYIAGPSHVLPTARSAKFSSGLGVTDFMKRTSLIECDEKSIAEIGSSAEVLAKEEGLSAHALSIALRLKKIERPQGRNN